MFSRTVGVLEISMTSVASSVLKALQSAQTASFLRSKSGLEVCLTMYMKISCSNTFLICSVVPAMMLLNAHRLSFTSALRDSFINGMSLSRTSRFNRVCVCKSSPVTTFPMDRSAGICTFWSGWLSQFTRTGASLRFKSSWTRVKLPSVKYDMIQQVLLMTSGLSTVARRGITLKKAVAKPSGGGGLPLQRFDRSQHRLIKYCASMQGLDSIRFTMLSPTPAAMTLSLYVTSSPATLLSSQMIWSRVLESSSFKKGITASITPASTRRATVSFWPVARLVRIQAASKTSSLSS
mmetsp:Transcript_32538/g.56268  ORF Transcript_32538/g.56268 Transcript_32538/m.56268 type:complete len:293 (+) Transcript_32538:1254-2132(+)